MFLTKRTTTACKRCSPQPSMRAAFTTRMQIDVVGQANDWAIVTGVFDSFGYEKIEYETKRIEADCSTPFTESGSWAGRVVVAAEEVIRP